MKGLLISILLFICLISEAQKPNWQNLDLDTDGFFGVSTEKAYKELLKNKTPKTVIAAIIDSGIDTLHEDLHPVLWTDKKRHSWLELYCNGNRKRRRDQSYW